MFENLKEELELFEKLNNNNNNNFKKLFGCVFQIQEDKLINKEITIEDIHKYNLSPKK
ncbi:hypothetical protein LFWB_3970 [Candidatus Phytoplasma luffae]|uniref:Uncharacterized protein n=1 Tax=Loofah witches'-broom phytoplasma TaxID=35773 RepID=A0A975IM26_LOWBP|nr:hypothetical protein [Candidatus Phytoplasma luffae]QTX02938.1 hypothetical protein LFWB_3680 [Candidatus Phytoplasma luffae]QTX02963.1 hypothetical protein LFWB_3970 [Candidatus Phytoplasma luffae]